MKEIKRFKCDYCNKLTAKKETMERHEPQCVHNPNSVNCFRCAFSFMDDYEANEYERYTDAPQCAYTEDMLRENEAPKCDTYVRVDKMYFERTWEDAHENLKKYESKRKLEEEK